MFQEIISSLKQLFYPYTCTGCGGDLLQKDEQLCIRCVSLLPHTGFAFHQDNPVEKIFKGRLAVLSAHSQFYFSKDGLVQQLIHALKYNNDKDIGHYLGCITGNTILESKRFINIDLIIPVPMHAKKQHKRGYNQSAIIAKGISDVLNVPVMNNNVIKLFATDTQTHKSRRDRWENVSECFTINDTVALTGKKILMVDDVITTGSTIEACGNEILQLPGNTLCIATLAYASK